MPVPQIARSPGFFDARPVIVDLAALNSGTPGIAHSASQVATSPATKKPSDPSSVRVLVWMR